MTTDPTAPPLEAMVTAPYGSTSGDLEATPHEMLSVYDAAHGPGVQRLAAFGAWCVRAFREHLGDVDGGSAEDAMERLGVLIVHPVAEACGEGCSCAEVGFPTDCYRLADDVRAAMAAFPDADRGERINGETR